MEVRCGWKTGAVGGVETEKATKGRKRKKRVKDVLNQETERSWHKDEKQNSGAPGGLGVYV